MKEIEVPKIKKDAKKHRIKLYEIGYVTKGTGVFYKRKGKLIRMKIGRASCRERVQISVVAVSLKKKINVVVATSGDTGAAAIDAIKNKDKMNIFVLHPNNKVSSVQRKLMTTVEDKNVFNIAIDGNFDDCQNLVKSMFADNKFSNSIDMSGVNSINWVRIVAQTVYYFFSYFQTCQLNEKINFSVPTGNFGDVYAGYLSKKMGLPIDKLIVATNQNDILHRAISKGQYKAHSVVETLSPSMDIQVASNFERLIYDINDQNTEKTSKIMQSIKNEKK